MNVTIAAKRWSGGWELWNGDDCWTQVATLDKARQQVIDYLDTMDEGINHSGWNITIVPEIGAMAEEVAATRAATEQATRQVSVAAARSREVVRRLRQDGYSVTDTATILGISRGRVSQLANG